MHVKATKVLAILFSLPPEQRAGLVGHCLLCVELVKQTNGNYTVHNLGIFCLGWGSLWHFCFCRLLWLHLRINFCLFFAYRKHLRGLQFPRTGSSASSYFLITLFCARGLSAIAICSLLSLLKCATINCLNTEKPTKSVSVF